MRNIVNATKQEMGDCPGIGSQKVCYYNIELFRFLNMQRVRELDELFHSLYIFREKEMISAVKLNKKILLSPPHNSIYIYQITLENL